MKKYVVTVFNLHTHGFQKVDTLFADGEIVTLYSVTKKIMDKVGPGSFVIIAWSPVDEFSY